MKLTLSQIRSCTQGAARVEETDGQICLHRFTQEQEQLYFARSADFYRKSFATAGIRLEFETDSENLTLSVDIAKGSSRNFFLHSIFVDGKRIGELGGTYPEGQSSTSLSGSFPLGSGVKRVTVYFPWSAAGRIRDLILDDGSAFRPVRRERKILLFGDSITQGYDASRPENSYASCLVDLLNAEGVNKAIGGEVFWPELALTREDFTPDLITVAYGTNDWSKQTWQELERTCTEFYHNLRSTYPDVPIVALAPIWRADLHRENSACPFPEVTELIARVSREIGDSVFIDGFGFLPQDPEYFSDRYLHPNDPGFRCYTEGLREALIGKGLLKT